VTSCGDEYWYPMNLPSIASLTTAYSGWTKLLVAQVRAGAKTFPREIEHHGNAVAVLPYDPVRRVATVVRQFRAPIAYITGQGQMPYEAVAGLQEDEDAETCARRETMEEAGLQLRSLERVTACWTMPGISTEQITLFLAPYDMEDRRAEGGGVEGENEAIMHAEVGLRRLSEELANGTADMKLLVLVQALQLRRPELFVPV